MESNVKNLLLLFTWVILGAFFCEMGLRIYYADDYGMPTHRDWQFRKVWDPKFSNLNSLGHRDHNFAVKKPPNVFRILAIGDSLTWGEGIKDIDDIYPEILEKHLNGICRDVVIEVLNVSQRGWNVEKYLSVLKNPGISYEPDIVMIGFYINDIESDKKNRPEVKHISENLHFFLSRLSYMYWYGYNAIRPLFIDDNEYLNYYLSYSSAESDHWKRFVSKWQEILEFSNENNIQAVVVLLPSTGWLGDEHPFVPVYRRVEELSQNEGAIVLNLYPHIREYSSRELQVGITDGHPSRLAHRIYGKAIFEFMKRKNLLPCHNEGFPI